MKKGFNLEEKCRDADNALLSIEAMGFKPKFVYTGGYLKSEGHIVFSDINGTKLFYDSKSGKYRGDVRVKK